MVARRAKPIDYVVTDSGRGGQRQHHHAREPKWWCTALGEGVGSINARYANQPGLHLRSARLLRACGRLPKRMVGYKRGQLHGLDLGRGLSGLWAKQHKLRWVVSHHGLLRLLAGLAVVKRGLPRRRLHRSWPLLGRYIVLGLHR